MSVDSSSNDFIDYLKQNLSTRIFDKLFELQTQTDVIIFSGVIRNFFLHKNEIRDIDIVLKEKINIEDSFKGYIVKKNSFGGFKIIDNNIKIDLWFLEDTWAFQNQKILRFDLDKYIPATSFFNFSSVCYLLSESKFIYTMDFIRFLRDKKIDVVYKPNSNYALCVVNSLYYSQKYRLKISNKLKKYLKYLHSPGRLSYQDIQIKHFNEIKYSNTEIDQFVNNGI